MVTTSIDKKSAPIGIFDSGVGGLTVARAIIDQLPGESILYIGDTARGPYGPKSLAQVRTYALEIMDQLVAAGVKAIVIACNTASAAMLRDARERYQIPVIEVIQPAVRRAVAATRSGKVGVIGTAATIESKAYLDAFAAAPQLEITAKACPLFVEYVEAGNTSGDAITKIAQDYLAEILPGLLEFQPSLRNKVYALFTNCQSTCPLANTLAKVYLDKSSQVLTESKWFEGNKTQSLELKGTLFVNQGDWFASQNQLPEALEKYQNAIESAEQT